MTQPHATRDDPADHLERRLAGPVIVAALVSVPAVFLTTFDGTAAQVGSVLNWASLAVLTGESVVLFIVARDRAAWLRRHRAMVAIAVLSLVAVVVAAGPAQVLRALLRGLRFVGALRVIRVNRILKAGRILRRRADLQGPWRNGIAVVVTVIAAAFVALILADPTSQSRELVGEATARLGIAGVLVAATILAAATFVVLRARARGRRDEDQAP